MSSDRRCDVILFIQKICWKLIELENKSAELKKQNPYQLPPLVVGGVIFVQFLFFNYRGKEMNIA
ncbi:hypothetical protein T10_12629 [Trichinella papuae]|uniref:Uncharacterized protein n=1 Tax=Trichinella papuae TaxID=268474 RepID=A0A0V1MI44_9BILA|nr:hypothetical protein T10_12629 [Trichinella papuae]